MWGAPSQLIVLEQASMMAFKAEPDDNLGGVVAEN